MKPYFIFLLGMISFEGVARDLLNDFSECRIKTLSACDRQTDYAVARINCYKKLIEDHKRCERNVELRIRKERNASDLKTKNDKERIKKEAWSLLEQKYEKEALVMTGDLEKKKIDEIELSKKFKAYNSILSRQVIKAGEAMRKRVDQHLQEAHKLNALIGKSLNDFEQRTPKFLQDNEKLLKETERIIKNFESYFSHYQSEIYRLSQFEDNRGHYLKLMDESRNLSYEIYDMQQALLSIKNQLETKSLDIKNRSEDHRGIKRGEHLVTELFKARKELVNLRGEEKESLQVKVDFLTKYCLIEYENNPEVCREY